MLVYTDDKQKDYKLKNCNGYEIYRIDYKYGKFSRRYQVWREREHLESVFMYFDTLKEAREYARTH